MQVIKRIMQSWGESGAFLSNRKLVKQFLLASFRAWASMVQSLLGPFILIFMYSAFKLISASNSAQIGILFIVAIAIMCFSLAGLRASIGIKNRFYYASSFVKLLPVFLLCFFGFIIFLAQKSLDFSALYLLLFLVIGSPVINLYALFLLDAKSSLYAQINSLKNTFYFCILNAPAILLLYGLLGIALAAFYVLSSYLPDLIALRIFVYASSIMGLFWPYWSLISSLYIKRMHDQFDYYC